MNQFHPYILLRRAIEGAAMGAVVPALEMMSRGGGPDLMQMTLGGAVAGLAFGFACGTREQKLEKEREHLDELAVTDTMTGLKNLRYFRARFNEAWAASRRTQEPLALALIDLDRFKQINDRHGHPVGDQVLVAAGRAIQSVIRKGESAARIGGDEFALLLPGSTITDAMVVGERVRRAIERSVSIAARPPLPVTASVGVASTETCICGSPEALFKAADQALLRGKALGKDRVELHLPPTITPVQA